MKSPILTLLLVLVAAPFLASCSSPGRKQPAAPAAVKGGGDGKSVIAAESDLNEYSAVSVADPLEPLNRATFWFNHGLYMVVLRPITKGYDKAVPKPVRTGIHNVFENVRFPVRFVNHTLQGNFKRAGLETGRFFVNSIAGVGGIGRPSDHIAALANLPEADTGQTFAKWGIGHGIYIVLPLLGPSSLRETVGFAGDYALNPVNWISFVYGGYAWTIAIPSTNSLRVTHEQLGVYDSATKSALDKYLAIRSSYIQYRQEIAKK
jgi:phospholipid-binding lipoprotein MlaA